MTKKKAPTLVSDKIDLAALHDEEMAILKLLSSTDQKYPVFTVQEIQDLCFGSRRAVATGNATTPEYAREAGKRYNSKTSAARNALRRLVRTRLIERPKGARGAYRITRKARGHLDKMAPIDE